jgi:hypothetical protein
MIEPRDARGFRVFEQKNPMCKNARDERMRTSDLLEAARAPSIDRKIPYIGLFKLGNAGAKLD